MEDIKDYIKTYLNYPIDGIKYYDLNPVYKDPKIRNLLVQKCIDLIKDEEYEYIALIEARGFLIGSILADKLNKGIVLCRSKKNRLPGKIYTVKHKLEYGEATMQVQEGKGNVLIFDDVIATGGTGNGAYTVLKKGGYNPVSALYLIELSKLKPISEIPFKSAIVY